jgi:hypothetical protein
MKGPYQRVKFDLRRLWECPVCQRRERTAGTVTFRHCQCQMARLDAQPVVMKLVEDGMQRLAPAIERPRPEIEGATSMEVPQTDPLENLAPRSQAAESLQRKHEIDQ